MRRNGWITVRTDRVLAELSGDSGKFIGNNPLPYDGRGSLEREICPENGKAPTRKPGRGSQGAIAYLTTRNTDFRPSAPALASSHSAISR